MKLSNELKLTYVSMFESYSKTYNIFKLIFSQEILLLDKLFSQNIQFLSTYISNIWYHSNYHHGKSVYPNNMVYSTIIFIDSIQFLMNQKLFLIDKCEKPKFKHLLRSLTKVLLRYETFGRICILRKYFNLYKSYWIIEPQKIYST